LVRIPLTVPCKHISDKQDLQCGRQKKTETDETLRPKIATKGK